MPCAKVEDGAETPPTASLGPTPSSIFHLPSSLLKELDPIRLSDQLIWACRRSPNQPNANRYTNPRRPNRVERRASSVESQNQKVGLRCRAARPSSSSALPSKTCPTLIPFPPRTLRCATMARLERRSPTRRVAAMKRDEPGRRPALRPRPSTLVSRHCRNWFITMMHAKCGYTMGTVWNYETETGRF